MKFYVMGILIHRKANSVAWVASNVEGSYKRSVTLGMAIGFGNINGAVTANIVRTPNIHQDQFQLIQFFVSIAQKINHGIVLAMPLSYSTLRQASCVPSYLLCYSSGRMHVVNAVNEMKSFVARSATELMRKMGLTTVWRKPRFPKVTTGVVLDMSFDCSCLQLVSVMSGLVAVVLIIR